MKTHYLVRVVLIAILFTPKFPQAGQAGDQQADDSWNKPLTVVGSQYKPTGEVISDSTAVLISPAREKRTDLGVTPVRTVVKYIPVREKPQVQIKTWYSEAP